jgi:hypothetical protein
VATLLVASGAGRGIGDDSRAEAPVRMTIEVTWSRPDLPVLPASGGDSGASPVVLELTAGRILDAVELGRRSSGVAGSAGPSWTLGPGSRGTARMRIEAPMAATLLVRHGERTIAFPLLKVLEGPQRTVPSAALSVQVARVGYDPIEVDAGESDGTAAAGASVPLTVGLNVLTPEPAEALVRLSGDLRDLDGNPTGWSMDQNQVVTTNPARAPVVALNVRMPQAPGTYVLTLQASWEPLVAVEGTRIGRLIRRRNRTTWPGPTTAVRRLTLLVPGEPSEGAPAAAGASPLVVDAFDLAELSRGSRLVATGRDPAPAAGATGGWAVPDAALVEAAFRDRLRGWILGNDEAGLVAPATPEGLAWSAIGLRTPEPARPHRLTLTLAEGDPTDLGVALIDPGSSSHGRRVRLDAVASTAVAAGEGAGGGEARPVTCSWIVWPGASEPVLLLVNRGWAAPVRVQSVQLEELPATLPRAELVASPAGGGRGLGFVVSTPGGLGRFATSAPDGLHDAAGTARNLAQYMAHCGGTTAVLPDSLADREARGALGGQASEDALGPDRLATTLGVLGSLGLDAWVDLDPLGAWPGLPPAEAPASLESGLSRPAPHGGPPLYSPLHPDVRKAMVRRVGETMALRAKHGNLAGVLVRLGDGPTLLGPPDAEVDDATYARFVGDTFGGQAGSAQAIPGRGDTDPGRFAARRKFLDGPGTAPWALWRSRELGRLYAELATAAADAGPGVRLAVATPLVDRGEAGQVARRLDAAGQAPLDAWKSLGLDLSRWDAKSAPNLVVMRASESGPDPLARDLATHPDLDAAVAAWPRRGTLHVASRQEASGSVDTGLRLTAALGPDPTPIDEALGHALAGLDAQVVWLDLDAVAGREGRVARFARVARALPAADRPRQMALGAESGASVRVWPAGKGTILGLANDTPYTIRIDATLAGLDPAAPVDDLGRGLRLSPEALRTGPGRRLVIDLPPFGVGAVHVGAGEVRVEPVAPTPLDDLDAEFRSLVALHNRLLQETLQTGPPNGGFEPGTGEGAGGRPGDSPLMQLSTQPPAPPAGWAVSGEGGGSLRLDPAQPHAGLTSLRFEVSGLPGALSSPGFIPPAGPEWLVRAWVRAEPAGTRLRVWFEGEAEGKPIVQVAPLELGPEWSERRIRVANLPPGGLEQARLRFEPLTPGTLWIDDLAVTGPAGAADAQRRAQLVLTLALQAHRERRYADFARLAGSHWVRGPASLLALARAAQAPAVPSTASATGAREGGVASPAAVRTGSAPVDPAQRRR